MTKLKLIDRTEIYLCLDEADLVATIKVLDVFQTYLLIPIADVFVTLWSTT